MVTYKQGYFGSAGLILVSIVLLVVFRISFSQPNEVIGAEKDTRKQRIEFLVKKWQDMHGGVDFSERHLFQCLLYLHPQTRSSFLDFRMEKLSREITWNHQHWLNMIFEGSFYKAVKDLEPSKYYVNQGRKEPSLLLYELDFENYTVTIIENFNLFFLVLKVEPYNAKIGVDKQKIVTPLLEWTKLRYRSVDEVIDAFDLTERLTLGDVFTNRVQPHISRISDWKDYVIGFISKDGICLMLFKAAKGRTQMGFPYDFNWLNKGLYKKDGKTLIDPPIEPLG